ncbi:hypothetical protein [Ulvibacter litoralis]|uniref:Uncharacterized protein n=1 Tax=Ulvibacter litoralis TaxID=227084 RepID=A0A1G7JP74_9FLAO|nr:hypothetical protein [Ulvibacter litoralis]GHC65213.1 hypothetical protein GCM10008083_33090 [Ulvibacter litoralis]SDF26655.1 hypothetical protein SAMN05421855_1211 [Ulvibacter litoralis]
MKQTFSILITFLISINGFAQCDDIENLELGGTYLSRTRNYIPFEIKHKDSIERENTFYPYDIKNIEKYSDFILKKAKEYIVKRANIDFYNGLEMGEFQVNYLDSVKAEYDNEKLYNLSNYNVTYWILYTYRNNGFKYAFGLEFDKDGKMVSENKFPDFSLNPEFENLNKPCLALEKVKSDARFKDKKVDLIELAYIDDLNSFCWLVKEKRKQVEKLGVSEYFVDLFYVNVITNEIELIKKENGTVIACGYKLTKKTKD